MPVRLRLCIVNPDIQTIHRYIDIYIYILILWYPFYLFIFVKFNNQPPPPPHTHTLIYIYTMYIYIYIYIYVCVCVCALSLSLSLSLLKQTTLVQCSVHSTHKPRPMLRMSNCFSHMFYVYLTPCGITKLHILWL